MYRPHTTEDIRDIASAMKDASEKLMEVAAYMEKHDLSPVEFQLPEAGAYVLFLIRAWSMAKSQVSNLIVCKRTGETPIYIQKRNKNEIDKAKAKALTSAAPANNAATGKKPAKKKKAT